MPFSAEEYQALRGSRRTQKAQSAVQKLMRRDLLVGRRDKYSVSTS